DVREFGDVVVLLVQALVADHGVISFIHPLRGYSNNLDSNSLGYYRSRGDTRANVNCRVFNPAQKGPHRRGSRPLHRALLRAAVSFRDYILVATAHPTWTRSTNQNK
ncbi:MAG: hypothetical protein WBR56_14045, partial [Sedimenticolaceae bacterium]